MISLVAPGYLIATLKRLALPASALLNLFLLAVLTGQVLQHRPHPHRLPLTQMLARYEAELSPEDAKAFRAVMDRDAPKYAQAAAELRDARRDLERQLTATSFNQRSADQALMRWQAAWNNFMQTFNATLIEALSHVSLEGRHRLLSGQNWKDTGRLPE